MGRGSAVLLAGALLGILPGSCSPYLSFGDLSDAEKGMFVTIEDMREFGVRSAQTSAQAEIRKLDILGSTPLPGGYLEYSYEFEEPAAGGPDYIYIWNSVQKINPGPWVNLALYQDIGIRYGLRKANRELVELPRFYRHTGRSRSYLVMEEGRPVGNLVQVADDGFQYLLVVLGVYFDDETAWNPFFRKRIASAGRLIMKR